MQRRAFLAATAAVPAAGAALVHAAAEPNSPTQPAAAPPAESKKFRLKYAPTLGMFREHAGADPVDNLKFMADQGFSAFFDNGLMRREAAEVEKIVKTAGQLGMATGPFVTGVGSMTAAVGDDAFRQSAEKKMKEAVEFAKRVNTTCFLMVPGNIVKGLSMEEQTKNVVENLKWCCKWVEGSDKCIVLEPLNHRNHPGLFLTKMAQAVDICRAVGSPACKIVDDIYHQQITEGDLIPNIDMAWDYIGAFHLGDTPGRKEPTTGEINYRNVFKHIHGKGYQGVLCMEHGKSKKGKEGELAVIEAYRWCDGF